MALVGDRRWSCVAMNIIEREASCVTRTDGFGESFGILSMLFGIMLPVWESA